MSDNRFILYLSRSSPLCHVAQWLCQSVEISYDQRIVNSEADMTDIAERNPGKLLPVLQDGDLFLTDGNAILKYIANKARHLKVGAKWPGLSQELNPKDTAKVDEILFYTQSTVKHAIREYLSSQQNIIYDSIPDTSKESALFGIFTDLEGKKRGNQFISCDHITVADLGLYAALSPLFGKGSNQQHHKFWEKSPRIEGWFRVISKVVTNEWRDQNECRDCYESDSDEEEFLLAETIMDTVRNDRPDVLVKLARSGVNINMPLAVVEAVNRGNLGILKVMRDCDCHLKWPMAISVALRMSKKDDILGMLIDPEMKPEDLEREAKAILAREHAKVRVAMGFPAEEPKKLEETAAEQERLEKERKETVLSNFTSTMPNPTQPELPTSSDSIPELTSTVKEQVQEEVTAKLSSPVKEGVGVDETSANSSVVNNST